MSPVTKGSEPSTWRVILREPPRREGAGLVVQWLLMASAVLVAAGCAPAERVVRPPGARATARAIPSGEPILVEALDAHVVDAPAGVTLLAPKRETSPAALAGIKGGERLESMDGVAVSSAVQCRDLLDAHVEGVVVVLGILRDGSPRNVKVRLGAHFVLHGGEWLASSPRGLEFQVPREGAQGWRRHPPIFMLEQVTISGPQEGDSVRLGVDPKNWTAFHELEKVVRLVGGRFPGEDGTSVRRKARHYAVKNAIGTVYDLELWTTPERFDRLLPFFEEIVASVRPASPPR